MATAAPRPVQRPPLFPERYVPIRRIAAGGTATVWCAEDRLLGRKVAIKLLAQPYASDHEAHRRFTREARAAARLSSHPHVVTIYDVGETVADAASPRRSSPFIVMEHLSGGTVADALRVGAVTLDDAVRWLHEAAQAIDFAHTKGVLHRDIKPANLLLDGRRGLHVADFGIAQLGWEDTLAKSGHVLGTASYLPPERVLGHPATAASDLYALAVTAFELLTGELPFISDSYLTQARMHLEAQAPAVSSRNPALPRRLDAVLARGLAKAPEERWPSAEDFATAVGEALEPAARPVTVPLLDARAAAVSRARRALARPAARRVMAPAGAPPTGARTTRNVQAPPSRERRRHWRPLGLAAVAAVALTLLVFGFAWAQDLSHPTSAPARTVHIARSTPPVTRVHALDARPRHRAAPHRAHKPTAAPSTTVQAVPASAPTPAAGADADALEAKGHALLESGQAAEAVAILRQAVQAASTGSLTYTYALFDLGEALLRSGHPADAARVFWQRLQIPNQTAVVRAALQQALQALAAQSAASGQPVDLAPAWGRLGAPGHHHHGPGPVDGRGDAGGGQGGDGGASAG